MAIVVDIPDPRTTNSTAESKKISEKRQWQSFLQSCPENFLTTCVRSPRVHDWFECFCWSYGFVSFAHWNEEHFYMKLVLYVALKRDQAVLKRKCFPSSAPWKMIDVPAFYEITLILTAVLIYLTCFYSNMFLLAVGEGHLTEEYNLIFLWGGC